MRYKTNAGMYKFDQKWIEKNGINVKAMARNILDIYDSVIERDRENGTDHYADGFEWYNQKKEFCRAIAHQKGVDLKRVVYTIAVTSNNIQWSRQEKITADFVQWVLDGHNPREFKRGILGHCAEKGAEIILYGNFSACRGPKVSVFAQNLMGDFNVVTIDRHALRIALGYFTSDDETTSWVRDGPRRMCVEAAYHLAARCRGIPVALLQATTWVSAVADKRMRGTERGEENNPPRRKLSRANSSVQPTA